MRRTEGSGVDDRRPRACPQRPTPVTPAGFTPIGPPATLNDIVFAGDGTIYGTVDPSPSSPSRSNPAVLWRSSDHGSTLEGRLPRCRRAGTSTSTRSSPADSAVVYASVTPAPRQERLRQIDRIDVASGKRGAALASQSGSGWTERGTAYGATRDKRRRDADRPLPRDATDACDSVPFPAFQTAGPEPVCSSIRTRPGCSCLNRVLDSPLGWVTDGQQRQRRDLDAGGSARRAATARFGGPGARTLYVALGRRALGLARRGRSAGRRRRPSRAGALVVAAHSRRPRFGGARRIRSLLQRRRGGRSGAPPIPGHADLSTPPTPTAWSSCAVTRRRHRRPTAAVRGANRRCALRRWSC